MAEVRTALQLVDRWSRKHVGRFVDHYGLRADGVDVHGHHPDHLAFGIPLLYKQRGDPRVPVDHDILDPPEYHTLVQARYHTEEQFVRFR